MTARDLAPQLAPGVLAARFGAVPARTPGPDDGAGFGPGGSDVPDPGGPIRRLLDLLDTLVPAGAVLARGGMPRCDSTFGAGLALFLAATAEGCRGWLGADVAARLAALDDGLLIDECDDALTPRFQWVDGRQWRVSRVPLLDSATSLLCAIRVEDGLADRVTLVLQAAPPRLGPVQLMATATAHHVDATLRLATGLPSAALADLHESFLAVLADCRLEGALTVGPLADSWLGLDAPLASDLAL
ncbi:hypothetical protein [Azospirillum sp. TSO35-2]|uniref:hypothetical protein n=1 Tax=Azospirillum sp. TSO35-2 TaxID=716796 RepID=UPI000D6126C9|nr:hypothetical protein [Azospirillum sp. TSO35-2]PWC37806.1 hypothetical protein TSO352_10045 [Azospirillum sp. TSO35-2]